MATTLARCSGDLHAAFSMGLDEVVTVAGSRRECSSLLLPAFAPLTSEEAS
jgi:hypothetical protein